MIVSAFNLIEIDWKKSFPWSQNLVKVLATRGNGKWKNKTPLSGIGSRLGNSGASLLQADRPRALGSIRIFSHLLITRSVEDFKVPNWWLLSYNVIAVVCFMSFDTSSVSHLI
jgi:hypothetical protein